MSSKTLIQFEKTTEEILNLKRLPKSKIVNPIAEGKWSIREIVVHLFYWDKYVLDVLIPDMSNGANLPEFPDHDQHNQEGINYINANKLNESVFNIFEENRRLLLDEYSTIDNEIKFTIGKGKRQYSPESIIKIFLHHDHHHLNQIESFNE